MEEKNSYKQIMKATSIFGGVQVFNILFAIIRSKLVAVLLGPTGMGIAGLLTSSSSLVGSLTNLGISSSAVKDVAVADATNNEGRLSLVVSVFRRIVWITGLLGMIIMIVLSSQLSQMTFGNKDYTIAFIWLSVTLLFGQLSSGQMVILQGMRKLQYLAKANIIGTVLGLVVSAPLYYIWGIGGIVPAIVISSLVSLVLALYFGDKIKISKTNVNFNQTITEGKGMVQMGIMMSLSGLISSGSSYLLRLYIGRHGGVDQVGLFNAGFAIINTYVGMVFTAMGTDYYPRLSGVATDQVQTNRMINQQAEIAILILAPILIGFITFINFAIYVLYSDKFIAVNGMVHWAALGMFFKAASWSMGFLLLAKGATRVFFWNELVTNIYFIGLNILGYYLGGLDGLGISFLVCYSLYFVQMYIITKRFYGFDFNKQFTKLFIIQLFLGLGCFSLIKVLPLFWGYAAGSCILILSSIYSYYQLNKLLDLKSMLLKIKNKFSKDGK